MAETVLGEITDWIYSQIVGFLGNFFGEMGSMGAELFQMSWVQSIVLFFSYLAWALYATGLVVSCFECGVEYSTGRGNVREVFLNGLKGFLAVNLFTVVPVRLYELSVSLQSELTRGLTGYGSSIGDVAQTVLADYSAIEKLSEITEGSLPGFGMISSALMVIFCLILMAYAVIKVFFANLKRGGILLIQIAVGSLYMFSTPPGLSGWLHPMVQAGHRPVPYSLPPGHHPGGGAAGGAGTGSAGAGADALRRRDSPGGRCFRHGDQHQGQHDERRLHRPGRRQHHPQSGAGGGEVRAWALPRVQFASSCPGFFVA